MKFLAGSSLVALVLGSTEVLAGSFKISDTFIGSSFLTGFKHEAIGDPTHGRVNYVDQATATRLNLTYTNSNTLVIRSDYTTKLNSGGAGRNSVRLLSNKQWGTSVTVLDVRHMPVGCGTWPAFWTVGNNWPNGGEIDIIEGVNDQGPNLSSLHTSSGCTMPASRSQTGTTTSTNCDANVNGNEGCGVRYTKASSYGPSLNSAGGGWFAMERSPSGILVWHWARNESPPNEVRSGTGTINTDTWGTPVARFPNTQCDLNSKFAAHNIVINLTLCGDWAGNASVYSQSGCPGSCVDYVNNNPGAFVNAYWDIASVRVYTP
ncbi:glycoside hydrolase family 16 protein [Botryobasidium botryosum FD-172 SS1]|uniref:Glycoside hydrolase family 16 protein n=1 Tax=Botryobasidium botryosum (strain FD-172 SS1) TaxID=930990 RepID=A0A067M7G9_BOTB1|nr:glycoside hydrolase family 16 protein [Botryobasidium botryosum FD-172 SS1]